MTEATVALSTTDFGQDGANVRCLNQHTQKETTTREKGSQTVTSYTRR